MLKSVRYKSISKSDCYWSVWTTLINKKVFRLNNRRRLNDKHENNCQRGFQYY